MSQARIRRMRIIVASVSSFFVHTRTMMFNSFSCSLKSQRFLRVRGSDNSFAFLRWQSRQVLPPSSSYCENQPWCRINEPALQGKQNHHSRAPPGSKRRRRRAAKTICDFLHTSLVAINSGALTSGMAFGICSGAPPRFDWPNGFCRREAFSTPKPRGGARTHLSSFLVPIGDRKVRGKFYRTLWLSADDRRC